MQAIEVTTHYHQDEYLALEEQAEVNSEYYDGEIFPMASGFFNRIRYLYPHIWRTSRKFS